MIGVNRRTLLKLIGQSTALGLVSGFSADGLVRRLQAQTMGQMLPAGRRFLHLNFSNGGLGWLFTCLLPPSYKDAADRSGLAVWQPQLAVEEVITPSGGRFVLPRPLLARFEARGDRAALERVLDGCVAFLGCGTGAPIHQVYSPSFQLTIGANTTDVSSEVARHQTFSTNYPLINLSGSPLFGTGTRSFLAVPGGDIARLFDKVTQAPGLGDAEIGRLSQLLVRLNPEDHLGPYARTFATQLVATRESASLFLPPSGVLSQLQVSSDILRMNGMALPAAQQPLAVQLGLLDLADQYTGGGVNTYRVGGIEIGALAQTTAGLARGAAGYLQAIENGIGAENLQLDGVQDDPHNAIAELHGVGNATDVENAMLIKLFWVFQLLVELEKRNLYRDTTVLIDGDFSRVLNRQYDDGGVNGLFLFSGAGRLLPGFYGDSGVNSGGSCWFRLPDLAGAAARGESGVPPLLPEQFDGGSDLPHKVLLGLVLYNLGLSPEEAAVAATLREDEKALIDVFVRV